jgi:ubiquinone/menaquinone biosynthesis C-methylase UbiE
MSDDSAPVDENAYFLSPEDGAEMARLIRLDQFTTRAMGGTLAEQLNSSPLTSVLDIACGPGGWVLDVAYEYPEAEVMGIDISRAMINYANARARARQLANTSFGVIDVTSPLDFSDNSFDLINGRFLIGFLTKASWSQLVSECRRILRPGGILRLTETDWLGPTNSLAFERLTALSAQLYTRLPGNRSFSPDGRTYGITPMLTGFLRDAGFQDIRYKAHAVDFSAGTEGWSDVYRNSEVVFELIKDQFVNFGLATSDEVNDLLQQMKIDAYSSDFRAIWYFLTVWGEKA